MAVIQRSGWLKRLFMDEARGISGELPELLKA
jgi:2-octaprenyl-6-methoxyphenol hydroxylase